MTRPDHLHLVSLVVLLSEQLRECGISF